MQLVRDEKKYLGCLTRLNKMYMLPLTVPLLSLSTGGSRIVRIAHYFGVTCVSLVRLIPS